MGEKDKQKSKFNKDTKTYKRVANAALDALNKEIDQYPIPNEAKEILRTSQKNRYDKVVEDIDSGSFMKAKEDVEVSKSSNYILSNIEKENTKEFIEMQKDVAKVIVGCLREKDTEKAQKDFDMQVAEIFKKHGIVYQNDMKYSDNYFLTEEESKGFLKKLEEYKKLKELKEDTVMEKDKKDEKVEDLKGKDPKEKGKVPEIPEIPGGDVPDIDLDIDADKELENIEKDAKGAAGKIRDVKVDKGETGEEEKKEKRVTAGKDYVKKVSDQYKTSLSDALTSQEFQNTDKLRARNSKHCEFIGFLNGTDEKVVPKVRKYKPKQADTTGASEAYKFIFYNAKPKKPDFALVKGPRQLFNMSVVTEERMKRLGTEGLDTNLATLTDEDIKDVEVKLMPIDDFSNYLFTYTVLAEGIRENPEILDMVFSGSDTAGVAVKESRIKANIEAYIRKKVSLEALREELRAHTDNGVALRDGITEISLKQKIVKLEEKVKKLETNKKMAVLTSSTRNRNKVLTRTNYIPRKKYITVNPFTDKIDTLGTTDKTYSQLLKEAYNMKEQVELDNKDVVEKNNYKFFEPTEKVSIAEKKKLLAGKVDVVSHWYTGKPLSTEDLNVAVKLAKEREDGGEPRYTFQTIALGTNDEEVGKYTIEDIKNKKIVELAGGDEAFNKLLTEADLMKTKFKGRGGRKKISIEVQESIRNELLKGLKL